MQPRDAAPARLADVAWRPPRIATDRVVLRGFEDGDAGAVFAYASDPEVARYMLWDCHRTLADTHAFFAMTAGDYQRHALSYALALRSAPDVVIGGTSLLWRSEAHGTMELGYVLARPYWGQGLLP
jgi:ribosomal-protein-alanine N-acetyltransferase